MGNMTYVRHECADLVAVVSIAAAIACGGEAQLDYLDDFRQTAETADSVLRVELEG